MCLLDRWMILKGGFTSKYVEVGDFRFSYIERGNSEKAEHVILMVHGFSGDKGVWCLMGDVLPKTYHLLAVDLPGHGYTTRKYHDDLSIPAQVAKLHQVFDSGYTVLCTLFPDNYSSRCLPCYPSKHLDYYSPFQ